MHLVTSSQKRRIIQTRLMHMKLLLATLKQRIASSYLNFILNRNQKRNANLKSTRSFQATSIHTNTLSIVANTLRASLRKEVTTTIKDIVVSLAVAASAAISPTPSATLTINQKKPHGNRFTSTADTAN